jgi:hypothetical protein
MEAELLAAAREALLAVDAVVPHTDADGLAAGAMALRARSEGAEAAVLLGRGEVPWGREFGGAAAILDWGVRPAAPPGVIADHHAPEGRPGPRTIVVSSYGERPEVATAPLLRRIRPEAPAWLAAVGAVGDLGDAGFALPECSGAPKTAVRKLVPLVNAPRRLADGPVRTALALLCEHDDPRAALRDPRVAELDAARRAWRAAFERAVRTAPQVGHLLVVIRFDEPFQVHPLVATTWSRRLAPRVVLAANDGWLPGRVNFAVRGGPAGSDLRALLRAALPSEPGEFAHGHDRATGGSLAPERFAALLQALGDSG